MFCFGTEIGGIPILRVLVLTTETLGFEEVLYSDPSHRAANLTETITLTRSLSLSD